jgi:hypothetical protein
LTEGRNLNPRGAEKVVGAKKAAGGAMGKELRVALEGPDAVLGRVPAADVAKLILGLESVIARAATLALGKTPRGGRRMAAVERSVRLRLVGLEQSSIIPVLELPDVATAPDELPLAGGQQLSDIAIKQMLRSARGDRGAHPALIRAFAKLTDDLAIGDRYDSMWVEVEGRQPDRVIIDKARRKELRSRANRKQSLPVGGVVVGTLVEADFEHHTARLRTPAGQRVEVVFDPDLADAIQMALRNPAELVGDVMFDPDTSFAKSIVLREITAAEQMRIGVDSRAFWQSPSVSELQRQQGISQVTDIERLKDRDASDEEVDAFFSALDVEAS